MEKNDRMPWGRTFLLAVSHGANTFLRRCLPWGVNFFFKRQFPFAPAQCPQLILLGP